MWGRLAQNRLFGAVAVPTPGSRRTGRHNGCPNMMRRKRMWMEKFGLRSAMLLVGVVLMTGMLAACDDPDGAGGDPGGQPAIPTD